MDKKELTQDVIAGLTVKQIQDKYNCSRSKVYYYKTLYGLNGLSPNSKKNFREDLEKQCNICQTVKPLSEFYSNGYSSTGKVKYKAACRPCEQNKRTSGFYGYILEYLNISNREYKCNRCGYTNIFGSLDFHHKNPAEKEFALSNADKTMSFDRFMAEVAPEIDKCEILCPNCHRLEHLVVG